MMTPQEAEARVFAKASFGGYNMAQVDEFLDTLIGDYKALFEENTNLKTKMKVLVDKIEEFRSTEDAMRATLLSAQKMADSLVKDAEEKRNRALQEAITEMQKKKEQIRQELANEEGRLTAARNSTSIYLQKLKELYSHELEYIGHLSDMTVPVTETMRDDVVTEPVAETAQDIEETMTKLFAEPAQGEDLESLQEDLENVTISDAEGDSSDTVIFDRLQFGEDYEIK